MRFFHAAILAVSILLPLHSHALERIGGDEEPVLDFSTDAPTTISQSHQGPSLQEPSQRPRRFGTTNHISLGTSGASNSKQDGYSVAGIKSTSFSISTRLFDYFSLFGSKGDGESRVEYEQLFVSGPFLSSEYYTFDVERDVDSSSYAAGLRVDFFGMATSTPYIAVYRRIEKQS